jgi:hypothetical protein
MPDQISMGVMMQYTFGLTPAKPVVRPANKGPAASMLSDVRFYTEMANL